MGMKQQREIIRLRRALDRACARVIALRMRLGDDIDDDTDTVIHPSDITVVFSERSEQPPPPANSRPFPRDHTEVTT